MSNILSLAKLTAEPAPALNCEPVPVPEYGPGMVAWIAELTQEEREERIEVPFSDYLKRTERKNNVGLRAFTVAACLCKTQARDFEAADDKQTEQLANVLAKRSGIPFLRLFKKVEQLNSLSDEELKEIEKNSPSGDGNGKSPAVADSPAPASGKTA